MDVYSRVRNLSGFSGLQDSYPPEFIHALVFVLAHELVFDKQGEVRSEQVSGDAGGLTKYGIDQRSHPDVDIEHLTLAQAAQIYSDEYWIKGQCHELPAVVALFHFDTCVNMGIHAAAKILQLGLGIEADGIIGPQTRQAAKYTDLQALTRMMGHRKERYIHLAGNPQQSKFLRGWLNRMIDLSQYLLT